MKGYKCPNCGKPIYDEEALLCLYCGESLRRDIGFLGKLKYSFVKIIFSAIVLLAVVIFLIRVMR